MIDLDSNLDKIIGLGKTQKEYIESYSNIVDQAKSRGLVKPEDGYYEIHHILPKSKGGTDSIDNLVLLTMPEHIVCHILLYLAYPDDASLSRAANMMAGVYRGDFKASMFKDGNLIEEIKALILKSSSHTWEIKVVCLDNNKNIIRIYNSLTEASKDGFSLSKISAVLSRSRKMTGGYNWKRFSDIYKDYQEKIDKYFENLDNGIYPDLVLPTKKVVCCDLNGNIEAIYNTIKEAEINDGYDSRQISAVLVGKQKTSRGHLWYRYNEFPDKEILNSFENSSKSIITSIPEKHSYEAVLYSEDLSIIEIYESLKQLSIYNNIGRSVVERVAKDGSLLSRYKVTKLKNFTSLFPQIDISSIEVVNSKRRDLLDEIYSVCCLYSDGTVRYIFKSAVEAEELCNITSLRIHKSILNGMTSGGYYWKFTRDITDIQKKDFESNEYYKNNLPIILHGKSLGNIIITTNLDKSVIKLYPSISSVKTDSLSENKIKKAISADNFVKELNIFVYYLKDFEEKYPEKLKEYESRNTDIDNP